MEEIMKKTLLTMILLIVGIFIFFAVYKPKVKSLTKEQQQEIAADRQKQERQAFAGGAAGALGI